MYSHVTNLKNSLLKSSPRTVILMDEGIVDYKTAWAKQRSLVEERLTQENLPDVLMLLEHPPVYTLGTGADPKFLKFDLDRSPYPIYRIERGGEVTYHCPGQLVAYPIFNLKYYQRDLHWYLRQLEEVVIQVLAKYNLEGYRHPPFTGVWLKGVKVAAIGIKVKRWLTMHGFAVNVNPKMDGFEQIIPCGIKDKAVGKLTDFRPSLTMESVRQEVLIAFQNVFNIVLKQYSSPK